MQMALGTLLAVIGFAVIIRDTKMYSKEFYLQFAACMAITVGMLIAQG